MLVRDATNVLSVLALVAGAALLAGCDVASLGPLFGGTEPAPERTSEFRVEVDLDPWEENGAETIVLTIKMPGDDEAPENLELRAEDDELPYTYEFEGTADYSDPQTAHVDASLGSDDDPNDDPDGGRFSVHIRYWDIGVKPEPLLVSEKEFEDAGGDVRHSFAIPIE